MSEIKITDSFNEKVAQNRKKVLTSAYFLLAVENNEIKEIAELRFYLSSTGASIYGCAWFRGARFAVNGRGRCAGASIRGGSGFNKENDCCAKLLNCAGVEVPFQFEGMDPRQQLSIIAEFLGLQSPLVLKTHA